MLVALILARPAPPFPPPPPRPDADLGLPPAAVVCKATLVVVTRALLPQWLEELQRWAPSLRVACYPGDFLEPESPPAAAAPAAGAGARRRPGCTAKRALEVCCAADVVVLTYDELTAMKEMAGRGAGGMGGATCADVVRYGGVRWWRVCLDEAQARLAPASPKQPRCRQLGATTGSNMMTCYNALLCCFLCIVVLFLMYETL